jgi:predicted transcriptional regulator
MKTPIFDKELIKQSGIAKKLGIDRSYVSRLVNGQRTGPKAKKQLERIKEVIRTIPKAA